MKFSLRSACSVFSPAFLALSASGQTHTYVPGGGDWFDSAKWAGGAVPDAATANVSLPNNNGVAYTVTLGPDREATIGRLEIKRDARLVIPDQHTLFWDLGGGLADARLDIGGFLDVGGQAENTNFGITLLGAGDAKVSGGVLRLNRSALVSATGNHRLLNSATLTGSGLVSGTLVNSTPDAVIQAARAGEALQLVASHDGENKGRLEAVGGGELVLISGTWRNRDGVIRANTAAGENPDSRVRIAAEVRGGRVEQNSGRVTLNAWLRGDTAEGALGWRGTLEVEPSSHSTVLSGAVEARADDASLVLPAGTTPGVDTRLYIRSDTDADGRYDGAVTLGRGTSSRPRLWVDKGAAVLGWANGGFDQDTLVIGPGFTVGGSGEVGVPFLVNEGFIAGSGNPDGPLAFSGNPVNNSKGLIRAADGSLLFHSAVDNHAHLGGQTFEGVMEVGDGGLITCRNRVEGGLLRTHTNGLIRLRGAILDGGNRPGAAGLANQQQHPLRLGRGQPADLGPLVEDTAILVGDLTFDATPLVLAADGQDTILYIQRAEFPLFNGNGDPAGVETHPVRLLGGPGGGIRLREAGDVVRTWQNRADDLVLNATDIEGVGRVECPLVNLLAGRVVAANPLSNAGGELRVAIHPLTNMGGILAATDGCDLVLEGVNLLQLVAPPTTTSGTLVAYQTARVRIESASVVRGGFIVDEGGRTLVSDSTLGDVSFLRGAAGAGRTAELSRCFLEGTLTNHGLLHVTSSPVADITLEARSEVRIEGTGELNLADGAVIQDTAAVEADRATLVLGSGQTLTGGGNVLCRLVNHGRVVLPAGRSSTYARSLTGAGSVEVAGTLNLPDGADVTGPLLATGAGQIISMGGGNIVGTHSGSIIATGGGNVVSGNGGGIIATGGGNVVSGNGGTIIATGGGNIIAVGGGNVVSGNGGTIIATGGGNIIAVGGGNVISGNGGTIIATGGGNIIAVGGGNVISGNGGSIIATGGGNVRGNLAPGASPGRLDVHADLEIPAGDSLFIELAGTVPGVTHDFLNVSRTNHLGQVSGHNVRLEGTLDVRLRDGFHSAIQPGDSFTVLSTTGVVAPFAFANVVNGRVATADRFGTLAVTLSPDSRHVVLSDFQPLPHPCVDWAVGRGLAGADAQPGADPDHDGRMNLEEFAFDSDPKTPSVGGVFAGVNQGGVFTVSITRRRGETHRIAYTVETSPTAGDAGPWTAPTAPWTSSVQGVDADFEILTLTVPSGEEARFVRIRAAAL